MSGLLFYFDRSVGRSVPEALRSLGLCVSHHHDGHGFAHDMDDDEWLAEAGARGWVVVTHDAKFTKKGFEHEAEAVHQHKVGVFVLWGGDATRWEKMQCFARAYDKMKEAAVNTPCPFIFKVNRAGNLTREM